MQNILFIGNSYTYFNDMPQIFEQLARENAKDVFVSSVTKGGRKLIAYEDPLDPITQKLDVLLKDHKYDVCFIQEQSVLPAIDFDLFIRGVDCVFDKVKEHAERLFLYATWGRKSGSETLSKYGWTTETMTRLLADAYGKAAEHIGAEISPVGMNFLKATEVYPEINLHNDDLSHPSYRGSCLAALTHYQTVFCEFPANTDALNLSEEEISAFRLILCDQEKE